MNEKVDIQIAKEDCPCKKCVWAMGTPNLLNCLNFRVKPSSVFYDSQKCPKFEEIEFDSDDEEEDEDE